MSTPSQRFGPNSTRLLNRFLILVRGVSAHEVDDHKDDGRGEDSPNYDKQQFHAATLASLATKAIPAMDGLVESADLAADRPKLAGISAYIPLWRASAFMAMSQKEDPPWMTSHKQRPAAVAVSAFSWPQLSLFWFCFTRSLRAGLPVPQLTQLPSGRPKALRQHLKKPHQQPLRYLSQNKTTHRDHERGGRSNASAFSLRARALNTPQIEACPC